MLNRYLLNSNRLASPESRSNRRLTSTKSMESTHAQMSNIDEHQAVSPDKRTLMSTHKCQMVIDNYSYPTFFSPVQTTKFNLHKQGKSELGQKLEFTPTMPKNNDTQVIVDEDFAADDQSGQPTGRDANVLQISKQASSTNSNQKMRSFKTQSKNDSNLFAQSQFPMASYGLSEKENVTEEQSPILLYGRRSQTSRQLA